MSAGPVQTVTFSADVLRSHGEALLQAAGVPPEDAAIMTDICIDASLRGEDSHGVRLLPPHLGRLKAGSIRQKPKVTVRMSKGPCALLDAHLSMGPVVAVRAMRLAIEKAREFGIGMVGVYQANSFSSAKHYPLMAVREGMIGIVRTNTGPMMPPHGGRTPTVGNNPISIAAPAGEEYPFVYDIACAIAREKIWQAKAEGRPIPRDWALGADGNPTTDPEEALSRGALLPFGDGFKAFGLALSNEVLTSVLFGGAVFCGGAGKFRPYETRYNASHFFQAIDIGAFTPLDDFKARMDEMIRKVKSSELRPGFDRVYLPGERGFIEMKKREVEGIPVDVGVLSELNEWADELKVPALQ